MRPMAKASRAGQMADEANLIGEPETLRLRLEFCRVRPFAGDGRGHAAAGSLEHRQRLDEHIDGLDRPQFADADDVGRRPAAALTGSNSDSPMPLRTTRTMRAAARPTWRGTARRYSCFRTGTDRCAQFRSRSSDAIKAAAERAGTINQRAAVRRIDADGVRRRSAQAAPRPRPWRRGHAARRAPARRSAARCAAARRCRDGLSSRAMGTRSTPSASCGASSASTASARAPPVVLSTMRPTRWPRSVWPRATSTHVAEQSAERRAQECTIFRLVGAKAAAAPAANCAGAERCGTRAEARTNRARIAHARVLKLEGKTLSRIEGSGG